MNIKELNTKAFDVLRDTFGYSTYKYEQKYIIAKHDPVNNKIKVAVKSESEFPNVKLTLGPKGTVMESVQRWPIYTGDSDSSAHTP